MNNDHTQTVVLDFDKPNNGKKIPTVETPDQTQPAAEDVQKTSIETDFTQTYSYLT